ncbi:MAG: MBL fold metallo-hydrolase [Terriglobales bacterium]|jgi:glyoxylase-like metal-dependent hydrolase (beta-lactamase superfamily II)
MHRITLGDFELTVVSDGTYFLDGGAFFGVVPKNMWSKKVAADERNRLDAGLNSLLVRTGKKNILIETGIGNKLPDKLAEIYKQPAKLLDNLHAAGVAPEDIDIVINTHLHFDHCGWNTERRGDQMVATFPKAKYYVQEQEWEHACQQMERDAISYMSQNYDPLIENGQMVLVDGDVELAPGISVKVFPGHTANMQAVMVESGSKKACYISDLIPTSAHLELTWVMAFDLFPLETIESRKKYYAEAIPEKWLTVFTHDDKTPWGYVEQGERGKLALGRCG